MNFGILVVYKRKFSGCFIISVVKFKQGKYKKGNKQINKWLCFANNNKDCRVSVLVKRDFARGFSDIVLYWTENIINFYEFVINVIVHFNRFWYS